MSDIQVIIVEDEVGAANNLQFILKEITPTTNVLAVLPSIEQSIEWLSKNSPPDLAFFDIQLEDGLSFEIFKAVEVDFPVIFTTAFDEYAIKAFKVNSVDYLLKPIKEEDIKFSLHKYNKFNKSSVAKGVIDKILDAIPGHHETSTFLIHYKQKLIPVPTKDFAFFYIESGLVHCCTFGSEVYPLDDTIEELELKLNPKQFFRANRQCIVNRAAIKEIEFYFNARLLLKLSPASKNPVLISKVRVPVFKEWMKGKP